ncbi:hypothetical protein Tsubulata_020402 [Turnera subulata]|uniref:Uncharacterized protein n=1 Tax=Turnera subulata TaxID=218843 RepID=A0A9Q0J897_9ROSI|nr:hypothetical protein Tsubulata_020402 [Turnera subulata]
MAEFLIIFASYWELVSLNFCYAMAVKVWMLATPTNQD